MPIWSNIQYTYALTNQHWRFLTAQGVSKGHMAAEFHIYGCKALPICHTYVKYFILQKNVVSQRQIFVFRQKWLLFLILMIQNFSKASAWNVDLQFQQVIISRSVMTFGWRLAQMRMERDKRQAASVYKPPDDDSFWMSGTLRSSALPYHHHIISWGEKGVLYAD